MPSPLPRIPRTPAPSAGADDRLTAELASALAGARRRAHRDGDGQIDTAHLLHSLIEYDAGVRDCFADPARLARVLGYLVQRSIGYGLRWQGSVEDSGAWPVVARATASDWSPAAALAMERARERAGRRGAGPACGLDLLAALTEAPDCRALVVLRRAGVDPGTFTALLGSVPRHAWDGGRAGSAAC